MSQDFQHFFVRREGKIDLSREFARVQRNILGAVFQKAKFVDRTRANESRITANCFADQPAPLVTAHTGGRRHIINTFDSFSEGQFQGARRIADPGNAVQKVCS